MTSQPSEQLNLYKTSTPAVNNLAKSNELDMYRRGVDSVAQIAVALFCNRSPLNGIKPPTLTVGSVWLNFFNVGNYFLFEVVDLGRRSQQLASQRTFAFGGARPIRGRYWTDRYPRGIKKAEILHPTGAQSARYFEGLIEYRSRSVKQREPSLCALFGLARFEGRCIPWCAFVITAALIGFSCGFRYRFWSWFKCHEMLSFFDSENKPARTGA